MLNSINPAEILGLFLFFAIVGLFVVYRKYINICFEVERLQRVNKNKTETIKKLSEDLEVVNDKLRESRVIITTLKKFLHQPPVAIARGIIKKTYTMKIGAPCVRVHESNKTSNVNGILLYEVLGQKEYISFDKLKDLSKVKEEYLFNYLEDNSHSEKYWVEKSMEPVLGNKLKGIPRRRT